MNFTLKGVESTTKGMKVSIVMDNDQKTTSVTVFPAVPLVFSEFFNELNTLVADQYSIYDAAEVSLTGYAITTTNDIDKLKFKAKIRIGEKFGEGVFEKDFFTKNNLFDEPCENEFQEKSNKNQLFINNFLQTHLELQDYIQENYTKMISDPYSVQMQIFDGVTISLSN